MNDELVDKLSEAFNSNQYMIIIWNVKEGRLNYYRKTENFPMVDFPEAIRQLWMDFANQQEPAKLTLNAEQINQYLSKPPE
jgi:hypothetical protein